MESRLEGLLEVIETSEAQSVGFQKLIDFFFKRADKMSTLKRKNFF